MTARYVKNVWGYAGPSLLHLGMLGVVVGILLTSLTQSSGALTFVEGEVALLGAPLLDARWGPLAETPTLEYDMRLDRIDVTYWPGGEPRQVACSYTIAVEDDVREVVVEANAPVIVEGLRIFQDPRVGYAYAVTVQRGGVVMKPRLDMPLPASPTTPSYVDQVLENGDLLRAKVTHDPRVPGGAPVLTLRLVRNSLVIGQESFETTGSATIGDTRVSVDASGRWSTVILERTHGMGLLFASFFLILIGALLLYGATPREITVTKHDDGRITADWHAVRSARLYAREERTFREVAAGPEE